MCEGLFLFSLISIAAIEFALNLQRLDEESTFFAAKKVFLEIADPPTPPKESGPLFLVGGSGRLCFVQRATKKSPKVRNPKNFPLLLSSLCYHPDQSKVVHSAQANKLREDIFLRGERLSLGFGAKKSFG